MRQYDVFPNPARALRRERPFVLILQHGRVDRTLTSVVAPLSRPEFVRREPRLTPMLQMLGQPLVLVTYELAAIERRALEGAALDNLAAFSFEIQNALDVVFSAAG